MLPVHRNRRIVARPKMLFEELEERIVLDAAVDNALYGTDVPANNDPVCSWCTHHSNGSASQGAATPFQAEVLDTDGEDFFGRLYANEDAIVRGTLHEGSPDHSREVKIVSNLSGTHTVYLLFNGSGHGCTYGANGQYSAADFPGWKQDKDNCFLLSHDLLPNVPLDLDFDKTNGVVSFAMAVDTMPHTGCHVTTPELALHDHWAFDNSWHDTYDISLVNGFNFGVTMDTPYGDTIKALAETGNSRNRGVFGIGNDACCASCKPPPSCCEVWGDKIAGEAHPTANGEAAKCFKSDPYEPCPEDVLPHDGTGRCSPDPLCQINGVQSAAIGYNKTFTVTFLG